MDMRFRNRLFGDHRRDRESDEEDTPVLSCAETVLLLAVYDVVAIVDLFVGDRSVLVSVCGDYCLVRDIDIADQIHNTAHPRIDRTRDNPRGE